MVFTNDMNVFIENIQKQKARIFWNDTKKYQKFQTPSPTTSTVDVSPPVSPDVSPVNSTSTKGLKRAKPGDFKVGQIVRYNQFKKQRYCKILKIASSGKSFQKQDHCYKDGKFVPTFIPNKTDKDTLNTNRVLYIVA